MEKRREAGLLTSRAALTGVREVMEPPSEGEKSRDWCKFSFSEGQSAPSFSGEFLKIKTKDFKF